MHHTRDTRGTVQVDGETYEWAVRRQPQPKADGTWAGMAFTLKQAGYKREAIVQFPMPMRPNGRPDMEKQRVSIDAVRNSVTAILEAGWEPMSRGRAMVFDVDADGH